MGDVIFYVPYKPYKRETETRDEIGIVSTIRVIHGITNEENVECESRDTRKEMRTIKKY